MQWALDHWDEAGPRLVALLDAYARGRDRSEQTEQTLFLAIHLLGEKGEAAAFSPLCRLLLDAEASDLILGDAITSTLRGILISTYDGDLAALQAVIEAEGADEFVREVALLALAYLARTGRVSEAEMRAYLLHLLAEMQPQAEHFVWIGWLLAVAHLGYEDLAEQVEGLIRRGFVSERDWRIADFRADLRRTLADPERMAGFAHDRIGPFTDAIGELGKWAGFSDQDDTPALSNGPEYEPRQEPVINPLRGVGRNDPCPCGSGRKFKKCCLGVLGSAA
jgi:Protein of unknown function (DUF1186)/SEC-C motif